MTMTLDFAKRFFDERNEKQTNIAMSENLKIEIDLDWEK